MRTLVINKQRPAVTDISCRFLPGGGKPTSLATKLAVSISMNQPSKPLFSSRRELEAYQLDRLNRLLGEILPANDFYRKKSAGFPTKLDSLEQWSSFPTTTKLELSQAADEHGVAPHHTYPHDDYTRFHRTSGSTGRPLIVMDRPADWRWWIETWQDVLDAAELTRHDIVFMAFSFGPFIGFWSANEACLSRGCRVVPGGAIDRCAY